MPEGVEAPRADDSGSNEDAKSFPKFMELPSELRLRVWQLALKPRVVARRSIDPPLTFAQSEPVPLLSTCQESRAAAFLYAKYQTLSDADACPVYFSPDLDYFLVSPGRPGGFWEPWDGFIPDRWLPRNPEMKVVHHILLNISFHFDRELCKAEAFASLSNIKTILIVADADNLGVAYSLKLINDIERIKSRYHLLEIRSKADPSRVPVHVPYIAIGCMGWPEAMPSEDRRWFNEHLLATCETELDIEVYKAKRKEGRLRVKQERGVPIETFDMPQERGDTIEILDMPPRWWSIRWALGLVKFKKRWPLSHRIRNKLFRRTYPARELESYGPS